MGVSRLVEIAFPGKEKTSRNSKKKVSGVERGGTDHRTEFVKTP